MFPDYNCSCFLTILSCKPDISCLCQPCFPGFPHSLCNLELPHKSETNTWGNGVNQVKWKGKPVAAPAQEAPKRVREAQTDSCSKWIFCKPKSFPRWVFLERQPAASLACSHVVQCLASTSIHFTSGAGPKDHSSESPSDFLFQEVCGDRGYPKQTATVVRSNHHLKFLSAITIPW